MIDDKSFSAINSLIKTNRMHKKLLDSKLSGEIGLHRTQHIILMHLSGRERLPSQKELAEHLNITPAAVTGALKKLESGGYIEKNIGTDNRYNEINITEIGREVVERSRSIFLSTDKSLFADFTEDEMERFIFYLGKIQNNILKQTEEK